MRRGDWAADDYALQQKAKNKVIRTSVLKGMGVGAKTIADRTSGGPWQRILPGFVLLHNGQPTWLQRVTAAAMYGGPDAMITGRAGLALHGFETSKGSAGVLLLKPSHLHRKDVSFVVVERSWRMPDPTIKLGLPVAPVDRCLLDAARRITDERACLALIAEVVQRGGAAVPELLIELNEGCGRGSAIPRRVLRELLGGAHSVAEVDAQRLYAQSGLPPALRNVVVVAESGEELLIADTWVDDVAMDHEIDSFRFHASPKEYQKTLERRTHAESHGIIMLSHAPKTIRTQPELVIADLRRAYEQAQNRPRPNVRVIERSESLHRSAS